MKTPKLNIMKTPNLNIMKTPNLNIMKNNYLKGGMLALMMIAGTAIQAQTASGADNVAQADKAGVSVKLIDNKGTIKYMQSNNGITTLTSTEADNKTTTTWQLGGSLVDNTYIDVEGKIFSLDGLKLETGTPATTSTTQTGHAAGTTTTLSTDTGWTLVVRDEASGELKKLLATDLISGIRVVHTQTADATIDEAITVTGLPVLTAGSTFAKLFVYRNGAKLRSGTDFVATANTVTITYSATDLPMYKDDVIEIQYIK